MGTSDAYGGSVGWNDTRQDTDAWLDGRTGPEETEAGGDLDQTEEESEQTIPIGTLPMPQDNPDLIRLLRGVARHLSLASGGSGTGGGGTGGSGTGGGGTGGGGTGGGGTGGGGRRRAAISGGIAIAGTYGLRNGNSDALSDVGLSPVDLDGLSPFEQARRIVDAASGRSALVEEAELREVNANFVCWEIQQESPPSPVELVKQWITEYVFRVWLTEAGERLRDGSRDGASTHALEQEARSTLEARVSGVDLPIDGIRATHFESAIRALLGMLGRIFR